jgi:hypothetical protein
MGRYSDPYGHRVANARCYAAGNPNSDAFPYAFFTQPDVPADAHNNKHADAPADANDHSDANDGSHAHADLASDDL